MGIAEGKAGFDLLHEIAGVKPGIAVFKRRRLGTILSCSFCPPFTKTLPIFWCTSNQGMVIMLGSIRVRHGTSGWGAFLGKAIRPAKVIVV